MQHPKFKSYYFFPNQLLRKPRRVFEKFREVEEIKVKLRYFFSKTKINLEIILFEINSALHNKKYIRTIFPGKHELCKTLLKYQKKKKKRELCRVMPIRFCKTSLILLFFLKVCSFFIVSQIQKAAYSIK